MLSADLYHLASHHEHPVLCMQVQVMLAFEQALHDWAPGGSGLSSLLDCASEHMLSLLACSLELSMYLPDRQVYVLPHS